MSTDSVVKAMQTFDAQSPIAPSRSERPTLFPVATEGTAHGGAPNAGRPLPRIEWRNGGERRTVTIDRRTIVGSAPQCDIVLDDRAVSRVHAELEPRKDGLWIRDLDSLNGTYIEGIVVEAACLLHGYTVRVGATELRVAYEDAEERAVATWQDDHFGSVFGKSPAMQELFSTLARLAPLDACILIQGETGSGKEAVARAIHEASTRANSPFVVVDCAALSENLIEAELFGHVKGAFTGAHQTRVGALEGAEGGTVFLDEIGELPLGMQPKLLRVLESSTIRRVGESKHRGVNVRFLSATHRDLSSMVSEGTFREDLYFRLAVLPVRVPPLRERVEDIGLLLSRFGDGVPAWLTPSFLRTLERRPWRGNVRELRNFGARARALGPHEALVLGDQGFDARDPNPREGRSELVPAPASPEPRAFESAPALPMLRQEFSAFREQWMNHGERLFLRSLLERHERNVAAASKEAGIDRTYLYRLIRKHGL